MAGSSKIRIMIVDDSAVFRGFWTKLLKAHPDFEIVTAAVNAEDALNVLSRNKNIDLILLDVEMPGIGGLNAIPLILKESPKVKILMASSLTYKGSRVTMKALTQGAHEFIAKPSSLSAGQSADLIKIDLENKIRSLVNKKAAMGTERATDVKPVADLKTLVRNPKYILIGSSTGGPNALTNVLRALPSVVKAPILIVQHMPAHFTTLLAQQLNKESGRPCHEASHLMEVDPGQMYLAPGEFHMEVKSDGGKVFIELNQNAPENFCRPAVDVTFRSAAKNLGSGILAIVLTGMGEDGYRGCAELRTVGASILVQDEQSSVVWGMPGAVFKAGLADMVLPLNQIQSTVAGLYL